MDEPESQQEESRNDDFKVWAASQPSSPNQMGLMGATVKLGPRVCKTVTAAKYGDGATGEVKRREIRFAKYDRQVEGGFDFANPDATWWAENEEIDRLLAFLNQEVNQAGRYRIVDAASPAADLIALVGEQGDRLRSLVEALVTGTGPHALADALAQSESGLNSAETAVLLGRRSLLAQAQEAASDGSATETDMLSLIGKAWWIFGGRYVGVVPRRQLLQLDEHDIPLVCADGSLHIVELKGPVIPDLIVKHRNHWIVGPEVHKATMQATNYIRTADELGAATQRNLSEELGIDVDLRRVFATVVIGHHNHLSTNGMPEAQFDLGLRTYNALLNRVQVVTYDQLFDAAGRTLVFDEGEVTGPAPMRIDARAPSAE